MKQLIRIIYFVAFFYFPALGQELPLTKDTIVCIVDTTKNFTSISVDPIKSAEKFYWRVCIKSHYYDMYPQMAYIAYICFDTDYRNQGSWFKGPLKVIVPIKDLARRFIVVTDEWLNKQTKLSAVSDKVGSTPWVNYNFVVFRQDIDSNPDGCVTMHRVVAGYSSFVE
ncbi:MAG: hypothetical protein NTY07_06165 [Bacteroidia bacterium]|nr:hypothetical protein [Bacteroidia bacterium]